MIQRIQVRAAYGWAALIVVLIALMMARLWAVGQPLLCDCGFGIVTFQAWGARTSQLLLDPYSTSHVLHGFIFAGGLWYFRRWLGVGARVALATVIEIGWELLENSPLVIDRYRATTAAVGYTGDSVLNATGDVLCCLLGFWLAGRLGWRRSLVLCVVIELLMVLIYRDNLTLNVLMLLWPLPAVREWQMPAA